MKIALSPFRVALVLASVICGTLAQAAPSVSVKDAIALAEEALAPKNTSGSVYIQSVVLQTTSLISGKSVWTVTWSDKLPASKPGTVEVGLEIGMDGSVVHLVQRPRPGRKTATVAALNGDALAVGQNGVV